MTAPQFEPDPLNLAIQLAGDKIQAFGVELSPPPDMNDVYKSGQHASEIALYGEPDAPESVQQLFRQYVTETVVLGSMIRSSRQEPELNPEEVDRVKEFFRFIFNDIFRR